MEEKILLAELTKNCESKKKHLFELLKAYELAEIGYEIQEQQCTDVYNRVLAENEFFASDASLKAGIEIGSRITDEKFMFLLSDDDFERVLELTSPIMVSEKITDKDGYYLIPFGQMRCDSKRELVNYLIEEIVPECFRELLRENRYNVSVQDKLINIFKSCVKNAA